MLKKLASITLVVSVAVVLFGMSAVPVLAAECQPTKSCIECHDGSGATTDSVTQVDNSYHAKLGIGTGLGMYEKWCALPNFNLKKQGTTGEGGWVAKCSGCHIGGGGIDASKPVTDDTCKRCHDTDHNTGPNGGPAVTVASCGTGGGTEKSNNCHAKDTGKRGDVFDKAHDVHLAAEDEASCNKCQDCHLASAHQIGKGTPGTARNVLDTTELTNTQWQQKTCVSCHSANPHGGNVGKWYNDHFEKIACETCHTSRARSGKALKSRDWTNLGTDDKPAPKTATHEKEWAPELKWYAGHPDDYGHLPTLNYAGQKDEPEAKIYPFNPIKVTWFIEKPDAHLDENIVVGDVFKADMVEGNKDGTTTVEEMKAYSNGKYPHATKVTKEMNFQISHNVLAKEEALVCKDCHGSILDWEKLGYSSYEISADNIGKILGLVVLIGICLHLVGQIVTGRLGKGGPQEE